MSIETTPAERGKPRPVRAAAGEPVEVSFTVNGTPATLRVPARLTLADALRDHLGLTGTHLGCEHGVCGMCTVLVDGAAARACLMFAVQLDGAEIVTVEGLGAQDDKHPLQEAFSRHHALQCGFCTPGFLLSSYDLLANKPEVTKEELPQELSGVLCRCTGYRNIIDAVAEVAEDHPEGVPGPRNCGVRALVGRSGGSANAREEASEEVTAHAGPTEVVLPDGEPTIRVDVTSELSASLPDVWAVLNDVHMVAKCLPGAELTEELGDEHYRGRAKVSLGPIRLSFAGLAHVIERNAAEHRMVVLAQGADAGAGQTQAHIRLTASPSGEGTRLRAEAEVYLSGRIAQFGRALAGDVSRRMFEQFTDGVQHAATSGEAPEISGGAGAGALRLVAGATGARLAAALRKLAARLRRPRG
ncbi:MAG TPA: 2Fe-2S iron-sulfur cluster-binding protein [Pseudonocardiaceae bacterium]|jgi:xanthine dehydrogenase YagT iron-sulfur-binding subunit|nr:2Fe-2S iron-sulfur cluster-binding protein [Pseudonocardiaceae bacterium]